MGTHPIFESDFDCLTELMLISEEVRDAYRTIYAQDSTPDGRFVLFGDNYGVVHVFSLEQQAGLQGGNKLQTGLDCIYDLKIRGEDVICAGAGGVILLRFEHVTGTLGGERKIWSESSNATALYGKQLVMAAQTGALGVYDCETSALISCISDAHVDAIQAVSVSDRELLASAGEDGNVNVWDLRSSAREPVKRLQPHHNDATKRDEKFLSCCTFRGDWIVTGGGPKTALWHLGSGEASQVLDIGDETPLCAATMQGRIVVGGTGGKVHHFANNGARIASVPTSSALLYSTHESTSGYLFTAGNTNVVDVFRNYAHRINQII